MKILSFIFSKTCRYLIIYRREEDLSSRNIIRSAILFVIIFREIEFLCGVRFALFIIATNMYFGIVLFRILLHFGIVVKHINIICMCSYLHEFCYVNAAYFPILSSIILIILL